MRLDGLHGVNSSHCLRVGALRVPLLQPTLPWAYAKDCDTPRAHDSCRELGFLRTYTRPNVFRNTLSRYGVSFTCGRQARKEEESGECNPSEIYICRCSFYEIHNEHVYDLAVPEEEKVSLNIREAADKGIFLEGLSEEEVRNSTRAELRLTPSSQRPPLSGRRGRCTI